VIGRGDSLRWGVGSNPIADDNYHFGNNKESLVRNIIL
jgi:hypothetical protein